MNPLKRILVPLAWIPLVSTNAPRKVERDEVWADREVISKELLNLANHLQVAFKGRAQNSERMASAHKELERFCVTEFCCPTRHDKSRLANAWRVRRVSVTTDLVFVGLGEPFELRWLEDV